MRGMLGIAAGALFLLAGRTTLGADLMMVRSTEAFPEAMLTLQTAIRDQGYTLSRVQRVDIGLTASGFQTDKYRIAFFGKPEEVREMTARHPQLIPYLPLKLTIFAEQSETLMVTANPLMFADFVQAPEAQRVFKRWHDDIRAILDRVQAAD